MRAMLAARIAHGTLADLERSGSLLISLLWQEVHDDAEFHETTHVAQGYRRGERPSWLVEGVCDYVRFFKWEPGKLGRINPRTAHYDRSYRVTAAFLDYLVETYDKEIVRKLNRALRDGRYEEDLFQQLTGKTVQELDEEWRATLEP
jgi:Peptidase of plants and bacteria